MIQLAHLLLRLQLHAGMLAPNDSSGYKVCE